MTGLQASDYYHRWADELRHAARDLSPENRDTLICLADDLDELAENGELAERPERERSAAE